MTARWITIVAAVAQNRAIGFEGGMPWHLPDELKHFKKITLGKPVVMGRKTFESIGMVLPGRQNVVVTRNPDYSHDGVDVASSLESALDMARGPEVMIIGGGQLYEQALSMASRLLLTVVACAPEADTFFPQWDDGSWALAGSVSHPADERHTYSFELQEWVRI